jgi:hypothetical protein
MCKSLTLKVYRAKQAEMYKRYKKAKDEALEAYLDIKDKRSWIAKNPKNDLELIDKYVAKAKEKVDYIELRWTQWNKELAEEAKKSISS